VSLNQDFQDYGINKIFLNLANPKISKILILTLFKNIFLPLQNKNKKTAYDKIMCK